MNPFLSQLPHGKLSFALQFHRILERAKGEALGLQHFYFFNLGSSKGTLNVTMGISTDISFHELLASVEPDFSSGYRMKCLESFNS